MGGGSTIAAALAVGYDSIGIEVDPTYYRVAEIAIPRLAKLSLDDSRTPAKTRRSTQPSDSVLALPFQM